MAHADSLATAYATLGLERGSSPGEAKKRYRSLVRQWHPDRFADPQLQARAGEQMRAINRAYRLVSEAAGARPAPASAPRAWTPASAAGPAPRRAEPPSGRRLTREEIDAIVASTDTFSFVEELLAAGRMAWLMLVGLLMFFGFVLSL